MIFTLAKLFHYIGTRYSSPPVHFAGKVLELTIYPIKSFQGYNVLSAEFGKGGLIDIENGGKDRAFIVWRSSEDGVNDILTSSELPKMGQFSSRYLAGKKLQLKNDITGSEFTLDYSTISQNPSPTILETRLYRTESIFGIDCGQEVGKWLSNELSESGLGLLYTGLELSHQSVDRRFSRLPLMTYGAHVAPFLIVNSASLSKLNEWLAEENEQVELRNFRPSLTVDCPDYLAFDEDSWASVVLCKNCFVDNVRMTYGRSGGHQLTVDDLRCCVRLNVEQPCLRCKQTMVDFDNGKFRKSGNPLKTLTKRRRIRNASHLRLGVFGMYMSRCVVDFECPCPSGNRLSPSCLRISSGDYVFVVRKENLVDSLLTDCQFR